MNIVVTITVSFFSSEVDYFITLQQNHPHHQSNPSQLSGCHPTRNKNLPTYRFFLNKTIPLTVVFFPIPHLSTHHHHHFGPCFLGSNKKVLALISGQWFALSLWLPTCFAVGRAQWGFTTMVIYNSHGTGIFTYLNGCFFFNGKNGREIIYQSNGWVMGLWNLEFFGIWTWQLRESWPKKRHSNVWGWKGHG